MLTSLVGSQFICSALPSSAGENSRLNVLNNPKLYLVPLERSFYAEVMNKNIRFFVLFRNFYYEIPSLL